MYTKSKYYKGAKTLKAQALDFVQSKGEASSTEIRKFMYEISNPGLTYDPIANRGFYSSYFSQSGYYMVARSIVQPRFKVPSKNDNRGLTRLANGKYSVITL